jgi:hypothetical protein
VLYCTDSSGLRSVPSNILVPANNTDTVPPGLVTLSISSSGGTNTVTCTKPADSDFATIFLRYQSPTATTSTTLTALTNTGSYSHSGLPQGLHKYVAYATDSSGNRSKPGNILTTQTYLGENIPEQLKNAIRTRMNTYLLDDHSEGFKRAKNMGLMTRVANVGYMDWELVRSTNENDIIDYIFLIEIETKHRDKQTLHEQTMVILEQIHGDLLHRQFSGITMGKHYDTFVEISQISDRDFMEEGKDWTVISQMLVRCRTVKTFLNK